MISFRQILIALSVSTLVCGLVVSNPSFAALIASDDFVDNAANGELVGENGGTGWAAAWTGNTSVTAVVASPAGFSYSVPGGGTVSPSSALQVTGDSSAAVDRDLSVSQNSEVYISFLTKWAGGSLGDNGFAIWYFDTQFNRPNLGWRTNEGGGGTRDFMARFKVGGDLASASEEAVLGDTYFVVGRLYKSNPGAGNIYDSYDIWVNPAFGDAGTPEDTAFQNDSTLTSFTGVGLRSAVLDTDDELLFGALRIGTTWADVVPAVPEPSTAVMAAAFALLGLIRSTGRRVTRRS